MPRDRNLLGSLLDGRYELRSLLGEGAFGRVYLGMDRRLARIVAVKVIKPAWAQDPEWVMSFLNEARLLARVSDPGIVQIFDVGNAPEGPYYVAEFVDGESLSSRLRRGTLAPHEACEIAEQLCRALTHAHEQQIVHRDVKPANILISARNRVKLGDFGVARIAESTTEAPSAAVLGTPRYMAPEQARGQRTTPAADVYSIGVVLYEMLAGRTPFNGKSAIELAIAHEADTPPRLPAPTPDALERVVMRALAKRPEQRYPDAGAMARALSRARPAAALTASQVEHDDEAGGQATALTTPADRDDAPEGLSDRAPVVVAAAPAATTALLTPDDDADGAHRGSIASSATRGGTQLTQALREPRQRSGARRRNDAVARERQRRGGDHADATRIAPVKAPRGDSTAAARRPSRLAIPLVALGVIAAAILGLRAIAAPALVRVPDIRGERVGTLINHLRHAGLHASFSRRYASKPAGTAIAQSPAPGARIDRGATVSAVISRGAPPVPVPKLVGETATDARAVLRSMHLRVAVQTVAAPGTIPGTVTAQRPSTGAYLSQHRIVTLSVAEVPFWRTITSFSGGASVPFQILGAKWRVVYGMAYQGTCTFILFCEGPDANVLAVSSHRTIDQFGLGQGTGQTQVFQTGPGVYQIRITPGMDSAQWSLDVQDYY